MTNKAMSVQNFLKLKTSNGEVPLKYREDQLCVTTHQLIELIFISSVHC